MASIISNSYNSEKKGTVEIEYVDKEGTLHFFLKERIILLLEVLFPVVRRRGSAILAY